MSERGKRPIELPGDPPEAIRGAIPKLRAAYGLDAELTGDGLVTTNDRRLTAGTRQGFAQARGVKIGQFDTPATVAALQSPNVYEFSPADSEAADETETVYVALSVADRLETVIENSIDALNEGSFFWMNTDMVEADRGYPVAVSLAENDLTIREDVREVGLTESHLNEPWALLPALSDTDRLPDDPEREPGRADTYTRQGLLTETNWREKYQNAIPDDAPVPSDAPANFGEQ
jgi:hypothetical protein